MSSTDSSTVESQSIGGNGTVAACEASLAKANDIIAKQKQDIAAAATAAAASAVASPPPAGKYEFSQRDYAAVAASAACGGIAACIAARAGVPTAARVLVMVVVALAVFAVYEVYAHDGARFRGQIKQSLPFYGGFDPSWGRPERLSYPNQDMVTHLTEDNMRKVARNRRPDTKITSTNIYNSYMRKRPASVVANAEAALVAADLADAGRSAPHPAAGFGCRNSRIRNGGGFARRPDTARSAAVDRHGFLDPPDLDPSVQRNELAESELADALRGL